MSKQDSDRAALILMYHRVAEVRPDPWSLCVTPTHFAEHLEVLRAHTHPLRLTELVEALDNGGLADRAVVVTFDDGYADNLHHAKPVLERYDIPATVFLATGHIGENREFWWDELERVLLQPGTLPERLILRINGSIHQWELGEAAHDGEGDHRRHRDWRYEEPPPSRRHELYRAIYQLLQPLPASEQRTVLEETRAWANGEPEARPTHRTLSSQEVRDLAQGGLVEIGSHTVTHPVLSALPIASQRDEVTRSKSDLEKILDRPVTSFAYPYGGSHVYTAETESAVRTAGFHCACTTIEGAVNQGTDRLRLPRMMVHDWDGKEFARRLSLWLDHREQPSRLEAHEQKIRELTVWNAELERAKAWLEEQRGNWQRIAGDREQIIQEQQAWIAELERAKAWLEEQRGNWQRIAEALKEPGPTRMMRAVKAFGPTLLRKIRQQRGPSVELPSTRASAFSSRGSDQSVVTGRLPISSDHNVAPAGVQARPESEPSRSLTLPPKQPTKRLARVQGALTPREYRISSFTPGDLDGLAASFKEAFEHDASVEQIRRGLEYRYIENPFTGRLRTTPLVARHEAPQRPVIGFLGCVHAPILVRGEEKLASHAGDFFVREDFRGGRLARELFRTYLTSLAHITFTSSAGTPTQALCKYYNGIPLPQYLRRWTLAVDRMTSLSGHMNPVKSRSGHPGRSIDLAPIHGITDTMVSQAAEHTKDASFRVQRTRTYLEWRFGPVIRAADPECELLNLFDGGFSIGWIVARRREVVLEVLDWFVPTDRYDETLRRVCEHARSRHCNSVSGRAMQAALHSSALALGAVEHCDEMDYWTWCPDPSVYDGIDWNQAYLSRTDGDDALPWNLGPIDSVPAVEETLRERPCQS